MKEEEEKERKIELVLRMCSSNVYTVKSVDFAKVVHGWGVCDASASSEHA